MSIPVLVNGALGKMGQITVATLEANPEFKLVAQADRGDDLSHIIKASGARIVIDFSSAHSAFNVTKTIIEAGASPVIGTTGFLPDQVASLQALAAQKKMGGIIAPNFSLGAILMMKYAQDAARYLPDVEIIELHHNEKIDAPSGTAIKTAEMIAVHRKAATPKVQEKEIIEHVRGGRMHNIPIHSVRLPGLIAHQQIIFGNTGETLTLKHDMLNRNAAMSGVLFACRKVLELDHLVYGLEELL